MLAHLHTHTMTSTAVDTSDPCHCALRGPHTHSSSHHLRALGPWSRRMQAPSTCQKIRSCIHSPHKEGRVHADLSCCRNTRRAVGCGWKWKACRGMGQAAKDETSLPRRLSFLTHTPSSASVATSSSCLRTWRVRCVRVRGGSRGFEGGVGAGTRASTRIDKGRPSAVH